MRLAAAVLIVCAISALLFGQVHHAETPGTPITAEHPELRPAMLLMREGKTEEARMQLRSLLSKNPDDAELYFQIARSYLLDYYGNGDPVKARTSLALAMEALEN